MAKKSAAYAYALEDQQAVVSGQFEFDPDLLVTPRSRFQDSQWNWFDRNNPRYKVLPERRLRIDWPEVDRGHLDTNLIAKTTAKSLRSGILLLPKEIVEDLKRAFYIIILFPSLVRGKRNGLRSQ